MVNLPLESTDIEHMYCNCAGLTTTWHLGPLLKALNPEVPIIGI